MEFSPKGILGLLFSTVFGIALYQWVPFWPTAPVFLLPDEHLRDGSDGRPVRCAQSKRSVRY
jgi:hypothetical protein